MIADALLNKICRWLARVTGVALLLLFVGVAIMAKWPKAPSVLTLVGLAGVGLISVGILIGWRREFLGGITSLLGVGLMLEPTRVNGRITWFFAVLAAPGALLLASHLLAKKRQAKSSQTAAKTRLAV